MPKLELLDRLVTLLQERHGGEEAYAMRVKELGARHGRHDLAADETHFSSMDMTSMDLIIEALEKSESSHQALQSSPVGEICNICGKSVAWGSGKYINRIPDCNDRETRFSMGRPFPEGDFVCAECDARRDQHEWDVWTLSEEHIKEIASRKRISLNGVDLEDVAHYVNKGIQAALDNWDEIVYNAICTAEKHPLCIDCSQKLERNPDIQLCSSCSENYDLDRAWALIDESKLDVLDFNENAKSREQFKKQR
jgi:hypothetical protein